MSVLTILILLAIVGLAAFAAVLVFVGEYEPHRFWQYVLRGLGIVALVALWLFITLVGACIGVYISDLL